MIFTFLFYMSTLKFSVRKDHFQSTNSENFSLYGFEDQSYISSPGFSNIIFTLCGTNYINPSNPFPTPVRKIAEKTKSLLLSLETRYFAESTPFDNTKNDNLKYLTIEQILQDIADVLSMYQAKCINQSCKIFLVGSSDSADILSWFRLKYPQFSIGVWSSFGATATPISDYSFDQHLIERLKKNSETCLKNTQSVLGSIEWTFKKESESEKEKVFKLFNFPDNTPVTNALYMLAEMFSLLDDLPNEDGNDMFKVFCDNITADATRENFAKTFNEVLLKSGYTPMSFNPAYFYNTSLDFDYREQRLTWYMKCTQKGRFHVSNGFRSTDVNSTFYANLCKDLFDLTSFGTINQTERAYGGRQFPGVNAIFTRSVDDLNYGIMPNDNMRNNIVVFELTDSGESFDLKSGNGPSNILSDMKESIQDLVVSWINDECSSKCVNGDCVLQKCVCHDEWTGEFCDTRLVKSKSFNVLSTVSILLPTIILIVFGAIGWFVFMKEEQKSRIII